MGLNGDVIHSMNVFTDVSKTVSLNTYYAMKENQEITVTAER
jgi:hypothetical protein